MAIQPIDLQTLFSQVDKVGKSQSEQKDGVQLQQALQVAATQRKVDERARSVNETQNPGEGTEHIKDRQPKREGQKKGPESDHKQPENESDSEIVRDPALGRNIDLSG